MRVLIIEDDSGIRRYLRRGLAEHSFVVEEADDGSVGCEMARRGGFDLILLDLMLPDRDGFDVIATLRQAGESTPILCLTARDSVADRVRGLDLGADDYLVKPFNFSELLARMRALLRRRTAIEEERRVIEDLVIDVPRRSVSRAGKRIELSARQFALLAYMVRHTGEVLTRAMILENVWDMNADPTTNVVDVHITRLRKQIDHGFDSPLIHTIRGIGYVLRKSELT